MAQTHMLDHERAANTEVAVTGGSTAEAVAGVAAVVVAIIGLSGVFPTVLASVATIIVGAGLLLESAAIVSRLSAMRRSSAEMAEIGGGATAEFFGGAAGIVLGILAILGVVAMVLTPVAAIVFGGALLLGSATTWRLGTLAGGAGEASELALGAGAGSQVLVGIGAIVLGILALVGLAPHVLTLVAMLVIGTGILLAGSAISGRMLAAMHNTR